MEWILIGFALASSAADPAPQVIDKRLRMVLVASEPNIVTPTGIAVDASGAVLVIECHTHFRPPNYQGPPADRILRLVDRDGDGKAEQINTFFEGSSASMNLAVHPNGAVYVATRNEVFRLRDTNNDGKADHRQRIAFLETAGNYPHNGLSGFAFDHAGNIIFGFGENLGANYKLIGSDGTALLGGGEGGNVYRCRHDGTGLTRVATGFWNPFHLCVDAFGRLFAVDNDPDSRPPCRLLHLVEDGDYGYRFRNGRKGLHPFTAWNGELPGTLPMIAGTGEAPSGVLAYESDLLPTDYRGTLLATSWGDHRIERYVLRERGASYQSNMETIVQGGENFRPVGIAQAPDGSLYISDWVDKSYPLHGKGRVWKLTSVKPPMRKKSTGADALAHPDGPTRARAARALAQAGPGRDLLRQTLANNPDALARAAALEALAMVSPNDQTQAEFSAVLQAAFQAPMPEIRAYAAAILPPKHVPVSELLQDDNAQVQAAALRLFRPGLDPRPWLKAMTTGDPFLQQAARMGVRTTVLSLLNHGKGQIDEAARLQLLIAAREYHMGWFTGQLPRLLSEGDAVRFLGVQTIGERRLENLRPALEELLASGNTSRTLFEAALAALEQLDGAKRDPTQEVAGEEYVARLVTASATKAGVRRRALRALRPDHPALTNVHLRTMLESSEEGLAVEAARTLGARANREAVDILRRAVVAENTPPLARLEAVASLGAVASEIPVRDLLLELTDHPSLDIRTETLRALRGIALPPAQQTRLRQLAKTHDTLKPTVEKVFQPVTPAASVPARTDLEAWMRLLDGPADPRTGERVFFHPRGPGCYRCHQSEGRGGRVGPDLTTTARVLTRPRLVESILQPSKEIAPQFVTWLIETNDGVVRTGMMVEERPNGEVIYGDAKGVVFAIKNTEVEARRLVNHSIMPDDIPLAMTLQEFRDLLAYLSERK